MLRFGQVLTNLTRLRFWTERSQDSYSEAPVQDDQDADKVCEEVGTHYHASPSSSHSSRSSCSFQSHEGSTSGSPVDFWRVQLEAIYRKRNPYKLHRLPDLLENWKGQEALLYRRVCLAYDLDAHQFYACQTKWPEDADIGMGAAHVCVASNGSFSSAQDTQEDEQAQERSAKRSRKELAAPFAFCCYSETPLRRALGNAKTQVRTTPAGISPFAQQSQGSEKWYPLDPEADEADELAQGNRSRSRCVAQGQDDSGKARVLAPRNALSELLIPGQHLRMNQPPNSLPRRFDTADGILSLDVPLVGGRPLLGGRRVLPADEWPTKRRKTALPAVSAASTANH